MSRGKSSTRNGTGPSSMSTRVGQQLVVALAGFELAPHVELAQCRLQIHVAGT
jgi:hypothetical protein